jgi:ATP-dependent exoDNAse (exonuclease V) alpha subunit
MLKNEPSDDCTSAETRLVNGSRGVVMGFQTFDGTNGETVEQSGLHDAKPLVWPLVEFMNGRTEVICPYTFKKELYRRGSCVRHQVPLMLAWAVTIHKSQGQSIDFLKVDLKGAFANGQAYVAISRASSLAGLEIANFNKKITTSPLVQDFNVALDAGRLTQFIQDVKTWWKPVVNHEQAGWAELYSRNPSFRAWVERYPQKETHGSKRKYVEL